MKETMGNTRTNERSIDNMFGRYAVVTGRDGMITRLQKTQFAAMDVRRTELAKNRYIYYV
jgi:hypothetical protein